MSLIKVANDSAIQEAAGILKSGGLVAMPTETVYGLAANAADGEAVARVFEAKGRPEFNPLISHYACAQDVKEDVRWNDWAEALASAYWPGALTMILPRGENCRVSELASAGLPTMAARVPAHKAAQALIKACGFPLVAPSANLSGTISPTTPAHVAENIGQRVDMILAAGPCEIGLESTVIDLSGDAPVVLRPGAIAPEMLSETLGMDVGVDLGDHDAPKSPGQLLRHYAPNLPLRLNALDMEADEALIGFGSLKFMGVRSGGAASDLPDGQVLNLSAEGDLHEAAANLFAMMREVDKTGFKGIAVMSIPETGLGMAINDRLRRAAAKG